MASTQEYALLAQYVYERTPANKAPLPPGWEILTLVGEDPDTGFGAGAFRNTTTAEVIISYEGTSGDVAGMIQDFAEVNIPAGLGWTSSQVLQAIQFYSDIRDQVGDEAALSFTGHSAGAGLASLVAVYFGLSAVGFDAAPFEASANGTSAVPAAWTVSTVQTYFALYEAYQAAHDRTVEAAFSAYADGFSTEELGLNLLFAAREAAVNNFYVTGEALQYLRTLHATIEHSDTAISAGNNSLSSVSLHSMALLTALELSDTFREALQASRVAGDLLFDTSLYSTSPHSDPKRDFLIDLTRNHVGVSTEENSTGNLLLTHFGHDVQRVTSASGAFMPRSLEQGLVAGIMEYYYQGNFLTSASAPPEFVQTVSNGAKLDFSLVSDPGDDRGRQKLVDATGELLEPRTYPDVGLQDLIQGASAWYVQTQDTAFNVTGGASGDVMIAFDAQNTMHGGGGDDLLIGGGDVDTLYGEAGNDVLVGRDGSDTLDGGADDDVLDALDGGTSDTLRGGDGDDSYYIDGDTVIDSDGVGALFFGADHIRLTGGSRKVNERYFISDDGYTGYDLQDDGSVLVMTQGSQSRVSAPASGGGGGGPRDRGNQTGGGNSTSGLPGLGLPLVTEHPDNPDEPNDQGIHNEFIAAHGQPSPIILDLDGDGIETTGVAEGAFFDFAGDGFAEQTGWVGADDALLVRDLNADGMITNGAELFGNYTPGTGGYSAPNGYQILAQLDLNSDGVIDSSDPVWSSLKLWKDANGDGVSQTSEFMSLAAASVKSISVDYELGFGGDAHGNGHSYVGTYTRTDNAVLATTDVFFNANGAYTMEESFVAVSTEIQALPEIIGQGQVYDLHQALAREPSGTLRGLLDDVLAETDPVARRTLFEQMVWEWTGAADDDPTGRGGIDGRHLAVIEAFAGVTYNWPAPGGGTGYWQTIYCEYIYQQLMRQLYGRLIEQTSFYDDWYAGLSLRWDPVERQLVADLSAAVPSIATATWAGGASQANANDFLDALNAKWGTSIFIGQATVGDTITGTDVRDELYGFGGNDLLDGYAGNDRLDGGDGNDTLKGDIGNDFLIGGAGIDVLWGEGNSDTLDGGAGNDILHGGALIGTDDGQDTFQFGLGYGYDDAYGSNATNVLRFLEGVAPGDVATWRVGNDRVFDITGTSDRITFKNYYDWPGYPLERVEFADGTVWDQSVLSHTYQQGDGYDNHLDGWDGEDEVYAYAGNDVVQTFGGDDYIDAGSGNDQVHAGEGNDTVAGGAGDDSLSGEDGDDSLDGGAGNDQLNGGNGSDVFHFGRGSGQDTITQEDESAGRLDVIRLGADVAPGDVQITRFDYRDLVLSIAGTTDTLTVLNYFVTGALDQYKVDRIEFANGTIWDLAAVKSAILASTSGNDEIIAFNSDDAVSGGAGNDTLYGQAGNDTLDGGTGDDTLSGDTENDTLQGGEGTDTLIGGDGDDTYLFSRGDGTDTIGETAGSDTLRFGAGIAATDVLVSRDFNNYYFNLIGSSDRVSVSMWFMDDALRIERVEFADGSFWTGATLNNRTTTASQYADFFWDAGYASTYDGLGGDDQIYGLDGNDHLTGGAGNDLIDGGTEDDVMVGGTGDDTFVVDASDTVTESSGGGTDTVQSYIDYTLGANVENLVLLDSGFAFSGTGNSLDNLITGNLAENLLSGAAGSDHLVGNAGNDTLDGGSGADVLEGNTGDDTYIVDNVGDVVTEASGEGTDTVQTALSYTLGANVESLTLTGAAAVNGTGNALDNSLTGNSAANTLTGGAGNDTLDGGGGNDTLVGGTGDDTYVVDGAGDVITEVASEGIDTVRASYTYTLGSTLENLTLTGFSDIDGTGNTGDNVLIGNDSINVLTGLGGNDRLDGGLGDDTLVGGTGNDTYVVDSAGDVVTEASNEGTDTIQSLIGLTLVSNVENLVLLDAGGAINGTGNTLANSITGNSVANTLNGGGGADTLAGGGGDDVYVIDNLDTVVESAGEGVDTVQAGFSYTLAANVEKLTLTGTSAINGTGNAGDNTLTGNSGVNVLTGLDGNDTLDAKAGADTMVGGLGDDTYVVDNAGDVVTENASEGTDTVQSSVAYTLGTNVEKLTLTGSSGLSGTGNSLNNVLTGNTGANTLTGNGGDDTLSGGTGADTMVGGTGNDSYVVDNAGDVVTELASEGTDSVQSSIAYTLGSNVENLTLTGSSAISGTGNTLNNVLTGNSGVNTLTGGAGEDTLSGGAGADTLIGNAGNDSYVVDNTSDVVTEASGEGTDSIQSSVTYTLAANVENLALTGTGAINGTGNGLDNVISGNSGNNTLDGSTGADTMAGGLGNDTYVVDNVGDIVTENAAEGTDTLKTGMTYALGAGSNLENLTLTGAAVVNGTGNELANVLTGNTAANVLNGGAGADSMIGGAGDDTYVVDDAGDTVTESSSQGTDSVQSSVSFVLGSNVESLLLTGTANINGTGNTLANTLTGNSGDNRLSGGTGADTMTGGSGNDTYVVDNASDVVNESASEGLDSIESSVTRTLGANIELLFQTGSSSINGTGNSLSNLLRGNDGINTLAGGGGVDILEGGAGNDTLSNTSGNTLFNGGGGGDTLTGSAANDLLIGGGDDDSLSTGSGADVILFNSADGNDTVAASTTKDNTISLGGGITYADLLFVRDGDNLLLCAGNGQITLTGYYSSPSNHSINTLQVIIEGTSDYDPGSIDVMHNKKIVTFDFDGLVAAFDDAQLGGLTAWELSEGLASQYLSGSDTAALGGDLAYRYGRFGGLGDISFSPATAILQSSDFGSVAQTLQSIGSLQDGSAYLS